MQHKVAGVSVDLQLLHVAGADCGGAMADAWLAYRPGHHGRPVSGQAGTIYDRVRVLHARLGRRVRPEDLAAPEAEHAATAEVRRRQAALEQRRIAATPPTLPPGPAPIKVTQPLGDRTLLPLSRQNQRKQLHGQPGACVAIDLHAVPCAEGGKLARCYVHANDGHALTGLDRGDLLGVALPVIKRHGHAALIGGHLSNGRPLGSKVPGNDLSGDGRRAHGAVPSRRSTERKSVRKSGAGRTHRRCGKGKGDQRLLLAALRAVLALGGAR